MTSGYRTQLQWVLKLLLCLNLRFINYNVFSNYGSSIYLIIIHHMVKI